jgi:hypothetical protein
MLGAGTIINPIIKVVTTAAILAAAYLFIVRPVLDTTEDSFDTFENAFDDFNVPNQVQDQVDRALDQVNDLNASRLQDCIQRAIDGGANARRIERCTDRFGR